MFSTPQSQLNALFEDQHRGPGRASRGKSRYEIHHQHIRESRHVAHQAQFPTEELVPQGAVQSGAQLAEDITSDPATPWLRLRAAVGSWLISTGERLTAPVNPLHHAKEQ